MYCVYSVMSLNHIQLLFISKSCEFMRVPVMANVLLCVVEDIISNDIPNFIRESMCLFKISL